MRLEKTLRSLEAFRADADDAAVREGIRLDKNCGVLAESLVQLEIVRYITELLFYFYVID